MCQRCRKSRRICVEPSAAKQAHFTIHVENSYASGKVKRPRGPRSSLTVLRPDFDLQTRALAYYLQYHLQPLTDAPSGLGCLCECVAAWNLSDKDPMVDLALSSLSLALFARTQKHLRAGTEASSKYYHLLRVAQERIAQVATPTFDERDIEACLLAVLFMGRYEAATHGPGDLDSRKSFKSLQSWSHHDGSMAILRIWYDNRSQSKILLKLHRGRSCGVPLIITNTNPQILRHLLLSKPEGD